MMVEHDVILKIWPKWLQLGHVSTQDDQPEIHAWKVAGDKHSLKERQVFNVKLY